MPGAGRLRKGVSRKAKLPTEAPVNGGRNYNGPKVRFASLSKIWLYAGRSEYPALREGNFT